MDEPTPDAEIASEIAEKYRRAREEDLHRLRCMAVLVRRGKYWPERSYTYRVQKSRDHRVVVTFSFLREDWQGADLEVTRIEEARTRRNDKRAL